MARVRVLLLVVVAALLAGCGGSAPPQQSQQPQQATGSGAILHDEAVSGPVPADAASVRRITYISRSGIDDSTTHVTGSVYIPRGPAPQGGFHVVGFGPAVTGTHPDCSAPRRRPPSRSW